MLILGLAAFGFAKPLILIVKIPPPFPTKMKVDDADPEDNLPEYVAQEFDNGGRMQPVAWGLTDPFFRSAVDSNLFKYSQKVAPTLDMAFQVGEKLKVQYVMAVSAWKQNGGVFAIATLYKDKRAVWRDPSENDPTAKITERNEQVYEKLSKKNKQQVAAPETVNARQVMISNTGQDFDNNMRALASSWVSSLQISALRNFAPTPKIEPPVIDPGPKPIIVTPPPKPVVDNKQVVANAMALLADHKGAQAIEMLRDAVDAAPMDLERRRALITALQQTGQPLLAAVEARRAAALLPDKVELRVFAARCYLDAGQPDEAMADVKEAVAHDPDGTETRLLLGEIDLTKSDAKAAISQFDYVLGKAPTGRAYYYRALAKCLAGDADGMSQDLDSAKKNGFISDKGADAARYPQVDKLCEAVEEDLGPRCRTLLQRARVKPDDPEVTTERDALEKKVNAEIELMGLVGVPDQNKGSSDRRLLALKLLLQCLTDLQDYIKAPNDDTVADATITLGEGLKNLDLAKKAYVGEMDKG
ncbi:MAG TPA: tetratricopeptide repeat protein [Fimbriimonadaceae bacterium]